MPEIIVKFNPYHDESGRFTSAEGNVTGSAGGMGGAPARKFNNMPLAEQVKSVDSVTVTDGEYDEGQGYTPQVFNVEYSDGKSSRTYTSTYEDADSHGVELIDNALVSLGLKEASSIYDVKIDGDKVTINRGGGSQTVTVTKSEIKDTYDNMITTDGYMPDDPDWYMLQVVDKAVENNGG